jgi:hypothetical protein
MFKLLIKKIVEAYLNSTPRSIKKEGLVPIGLDSEGNRYYSWEDLESIPKARVNQLQNFAIFDDLKMTVDNLFDLTNKIIEINQKLASNKNEKSKARLHAQIGALASEMQWRTQEDTPLDIILNIASVLAVREDEDPNQFKQTIHEEKVKQLSKEEKDGNFFFLTHEVFGALKPSLIMSGGEWREHSNRLIYRKAQLEKRSGIISRETSSRGEKNPTTSSS